MRRLHLDFGCGSLKLAGVLDTAPGTSGLLIVGGGNEIRSGAFSGQSQLASAIARKGFPVFRFDRRGIGDSEGENRGFRSSAGDIAAALEAFKGMVPQMERIFAFGNCDAASALMLSQGHGFDGLILSNPWTIEDEDNEDEEPTHSSASIRARYAEKLRNPSEIARLLRGGVDFRKLAKGLIDALRPAAKPTSLALEMETGLASFSGTVSILLAGADRTAQLFEETWDQNDQRIRRCSGAGHSYVEPEHRDWLENEILRVLRS